MSGDAAAFDEPIDVTGPIYQNFLGSWALDVDSCDFEQGDPPQTASYRISEDGDELVFEVDWIDVSGEAHHVSFRARPDGSLQPFKGGVLADSLSVTAVSESALHSSAYLNGVELMIAQRTLSNIGGAMHLVQTVKLPDGTTPTNRSTYHRQQ